MLAQIQVRRDTADNWAAINPILALGEFGLDIDNDLLKLGDGVTPWNTLRVYADEGNIDGGNAASVYGGSMTYDGGTA